MYQFILCPRRNLFHKVATLDPRTTSATFRKWLAEVVCASSFLAYVKAFRLIYLNERVARPLFVFVELNEKLAA
jgi:hypothetical protein